MSARKPNIEQVNETCFVLRHPVEDGKTLLTSMVAIPESMSLRMTLMIELPNGTTDRCGEFSMPIPFIKDEHGNPVGVDYEAAKAEVAKKSVVIYSAYKSKEVQP